MIDDKTLDSKEYKAIFCDIFDTVVYRKVQPEFTKKLWSSKIVKRLGLNLSMINLYKERNSIETELGEKAHNDGNDWEFRHKDLSIEIYKYLTNKTNINISKKEFIDLSRKVEIEVESSVQVPNKDVIDTIKKARKKGKKIYCVSDMYLSNEMVEEIFKNIGIRDLFDGIYMSCEYLKNKKSGELYKIVLNELKLKPEECIMIGDNKLGDYDIPTDMGIKSIHIDRSKQYEKYQKFIEEHEEKDYYNEFITLTKTPNNSFEHAVFTLYRFIEKLYYNLENDGLDEVFFLSREGEYLKKLFDDFNDKICGKKIKSHYILVSRKSTYLPSLKSIEKEDFSYLLNQYSYVTVKEFLKSLNLPNEDIDLIEKGRDYLELKNSIVIFICTFDPFGYGRHLYSFENVCLQDFNISLNDKTTKIFLNTKGTMEDIPTPLRNFLKYIDSGEITDEYTKELDETVIQVRQDKKWREKIMTLEEYAQATAKVASKEAVDSINELYSYLLENDRLDDLKKAVSDEEFRKRLLEDYKQKL